MKEEGFLRERGCVCMHIFALESEARLKLFVRNFHVMN